MESLALLLIVATPIFVLLVLLGFLWLLFTVFARTSRWNALAARYPASMEPEGRKLTVQTIKVGVVRWRFCVTMVLSPRGLYLDVGPRFPVLAAIHRHPPVLIPWSEFHSPRPGRLYLGWQATQLSVGQPEIAALTFPQGLYEQMTPYLTSAREEPPR
jgi:hypothetical protein